MPKFFLLTIKIDRTDAELELKQSLHATRADAMIHLHDYVVGEWDEGLEEEHGDVQVLNHDDAVDFYFETYATALDVETYELEEIELEAPHPEEHDRARMEFVQKIARFIQDGEPYQTEDNEMDLFVLEADDCIDTMRALIDEARELAKEIDA